MASFLGRVARGTVPGALLLGLFGYGMREVAGLVPGGDPEAVAAATRGIPATMAAWGFAISLAFVLFGELWRGPPRRPAPAAAPAAAPASGLDPEVQKLLDELEAAAAGRAAGGAA